MCKCWLGKECDLLLRVIYFVQYLLRGISCIKTAWSRVLLLVRKVSVSLVGVHTRISNVTLSTLLNWSSNLVASNVLVELLCPFSLVFEDFLAGIAIHVWIITFQSVYRRLITQVLIFLIISSFTFLRHGVRAFSLLELNLLLKKLSDLRVFHKFLELFNRNILGQLLVTLAQLFVSSFRSIKWRLSRLGLVLIINLLSYFIFFRLIL